MAPAASPESDEAWRHVTDEVRRIAALRHLSLSTERKYLGWLRHFCVDECREA